MNEMDFDCEVFYCNYNSLLFFLSPLGHSKGPSKPRPVSRVQLPSVSSPTPVIAAVVTPSLPPIQPPSPAAPSPGKGETSRERRKRKSMTTRAQTKGERNVSHLSFKSLLPAKSFCNFFCMVCMLLLVTIFLNR